MSIIIRRAVVAAALAAACGLGGCHREASRETLAGSAKLEERLARLEAAFAKNADALEFLNQVYEQQKAQAEAREREEPAPDAVFAVSIADDIKAGQVEGSPQALVTIVEAWDFA